MKGCKKRHWALVPPSPCCPSLPRLSRDTSGWKAWHESGRRRSFWERIRSHFTEALCARLLRTGTAGREWMEPARTHGATAPPGQVTLHGLEISPSQAVLSTPMAMAAEVHFPPRQTRR